jgi:hypothetical protein
LDNKRFDDLTSALGAGTGRRGAIAGLVAGTAGVFSQRPSTKAGKKKCKKVNLCPQRSAYGCLDNTCTLIKGTDQATILSQCQAFCGEGNFNGVNLPIPGLANFCASNGTRTLVECPVPL